jgi:hypothetical protein
VLVIPASALGEEEAGAQQLLGDPDARHLEHLFGRMFPPAPEQLSSDNKMHSYYGHEMRWRWYVTYKDSQNGVKGGTMEYKVDADTICPCTT